MSVKFLLFIKLKKLFPFNARKLLLNSDGVVACKSVYGIHCLIFMMGGAL